MNNKNNLGKNSLGKNNLGKNNIGFSNPIKNLSLSFILKIIGTLTIIIICIVILIVIARNTLYISNMNDHLSPIFILDDIDAKNIDNSLVKNAVSQLDGLHQHTNYTFSTWIYVQDWNYNINNYKVIFQKSYDNSGSECKNVPLIALDKNENNLIFAIDLYNTDTIDRTTSTFKCVYKNIPLQKWVNIIYVVSDRYVNLFINGNIEKRCHFKNISCQSNNNKMYSLNILGNAIERLDNQDSTTGSKGFNGRVSKMQYFAKHLSNDEIRKIYENGPYIS